MVCGTPVVSTDCPVGPREILKEGKLSLLVPMSDHKKLADAILETMQNPIHSSLLKERAKGFSTKSSLEKYNKLFRDVINMP